MTRLGLLISAAAGFVFALGLGLSGMTNPNVVLDFLDLSSGSDIRLALVMMGALGVFVPAYRVFTRRGRALLGGRALDAPSGRVDARLLGGAAVFGVGWGLGGFCPGPGLVAAASGSKEAITFLVASLGGMALHHVWVSYRENKQSRSDDECFDVN